jgi:hypothetical protein
MKRITASVIIPMFLFLNLFGQKIFSQQIAKKVAIGDFSSLVVRNDVTIMLIEDKDRDSVRIEGDSRFLENIKVFQLGRTVIVSGNDKKRPRKKGIVYIPVHNLQNIQVNAAARIVSFNTLQSPVLNLLINGACTVDIVLNGRLNIRESDGYDFTYTRIFNNTNILK